MKDPTLEQLLEKVTDTYTLVVVASRRARQLIKEGELKDENPLSVAVEEITDGTVTYQSHY